MRQQQLPASQCVPQQGAETLKWQVASWQGVEEHGITREDVVLSRLFQLRPEEPPVWLQYVFTASLTPANLPFEQRTGLRSRASSGWTDLDNNALFLLYLCSWSPSIYGK